MKANFKIVALLAGTTLLVALGIVIMFWTFKQIDESAQKRTQTSVILEKTNDLLVTLVDSETSARGYLLTGDEAFLEPYLAVRDSISGRFVELRQLTKDPATHQHLDILEPSITAKMAHISNAIDLYRQQNETAALETVRSGEGKRLMNLIRIEISDIKQIEASLLAQDETRFVNNMHLLLMIIIFTSLLVLLLALWSTYSIYQGTQQRLKNLVHLETEHFLELQTELNKQLGQANATLQISEEKLAVTLNSIGDAVIATDAEGLVVIINPLTEDLTGWKKAEAIGRPVDEIFQILNEETRQPAIVPVMETLRLGTIHGLANHTLLIARDGSECAIADSCAPIRDRDGQIVGAVLVFRDVTERNRLDRVLKVKNIELENARIVAETANLAKSEFLSSMSHELRSPLNAILGFAQLMESDSPPPTPIQTQSIDQISQAGWHLLKLINEVLDLTKIESGKVPLSPEPVSLAEVLLECRAMIEPQAQQRDITMTFPRSVLPYFVHADRTRLKQILINLLSNAIKYNVKQGTVDVKITETAPERIRVSIRDSGAGLSQEQLGQLFQAFNRLGQEAGGEEGTGIGLVVAKRLVELMGGSIGVESTPGLGSMFWFELSSASEPYLILETSEETTILPKIMPQTTQLHTLLYIEDNPANLKLVEQIIARHPDLRLLTAMNGNSGIQIARGSLPDMILMDINLPDINGFEALKILRADSRMAHIPVIALSANAMPRDIKKGLDAGFFRYITKPIKIKEFMNALNETLEFAEKQRDKNILPGTA